MNDKILYLSRLALAFVFPVRCPFCEKVMPINCLCCEKCEKDNDNQHIKEHIKLENNKSFTVHTIYEYKDNIKEAMRKFKFYNATEYKYYFANKIVEYLYKADLIGEFDYIVSVPISKNRMATRGYNQSEIIAREIARTLNLPYIEALIKIKDTKTQSRLNAQDRKNNPVGAFLCDIEIENTRILLIDDITTTTATIRECAKVLYESFAKNVIAISLFHAV